jgi:hypothetical protein
MNFLEIKKKQAEIAIWRKQETPRGEDKRKIPEDIKQAAKSI